MTGPWVPPRGRFNVNDNIVQVKQNPDTGSLEWIEFSSGGVGVHIDIKDFAWAIDALKKAWSGRKIEINSAYGLGPTPEYAIIDEPTSHPLVIHTKEPEAIRPRSFGDWFRKEIKDTIDKELSKDVLYGSDISFDFNITRNKREMEKHMRCAQPFQVVDRVPVYTAMGVADNLPEIAEWVGARSYEVITQKVEHEDHIDEYTVVDFHVKDKKAKPKVDFHLRAVIGVDFIVQDPVSGGFSVVDEHLFAERYMEPRAAKSDVRR